MIIAGEHFVVHGGLALAVSVDLWASTSAEPAPRPSIESVDPPGRCGDDGCDPFLAPLRAMLDEIVADHPGASGRYVLRSEIPQARGLGSSAAVAVSLAAAALALAEGEAPREEVYRYAMISERIIHGNPSGVDPAASTYGGAILYSKGKGMRRLSIREGELMVCCAPAARSTAAMVERVEEFRRSRGELFEALLASSSALVEAAASALESGDRSALAPIMRWHQGALRLLGVSTPELESFVEAMESAGAAAKLTGAGGGGCVVGLPPVEGVRCGGAPAARLRYPTGGVESWRLS